MASENPYAAPRASSAAETGFLDLSGPLPDFERGEPVQIEFALTFDDLAEFLIRVNERTGKGGDFKTTIVWMTVFVAGVVAVTFVTLGVTHQALTSLVWLVVPVGLVWLLAIWRGHQMDKDVLREQLETGDAENLKPALVPQKVVVSAAGCAVESEVASSLFRWASYCDVAATSSACYLFEAPNSARIIPSRAFPSEAEYLDFVYRCAGQVRKMRGQP